ncbi:hypothetical protein F2Q69_00013505 [Brassica cretica]|uniref:Uncharacterized protein n=1 Tax=Brassica cretica TaxID=69181 RepID=A0A8S9R8X6_BRACR|nr:hypothetical protein F2Q69_00013505 [Brassica cretica]
MEDMNFGPNSIDAETTTSSDGYTEKSIDTPLPISIDAILTEAAKKATINLDEEEEESEEDVEIDQKEGNNDDRPTTVNNDRQEGKDVDRPTMVNMNGHNESNVN